MSVDLQRRLNQQGYKIDDVCEVIEEENLDKAADLEKELNLKYGYPWDDTQDYRVLIKLAPMGAQVSGRKCAKNGHMKRMAKLAGDKNVESGWAYELGKMQGKKNAESGHLDRIRTNNVEHKCPHCNKIGKGPPMFRWHFDNCKKKN